MPIEQLTTVPKGTVMQVSVRLPLTHGGKSDGFRWEAVRTMTVEEARDDVARQLLRRFLDHFMPAVDDAR